MPRPRRVLAIAGLLATTTLAGPAADAVPVYEASSLRSEVDYTLADPGCTPQRSSTQDADTPVVENGAATTVTTAASGTFTRNADPADVIGYEASWTGRTSATSSGADPRRVDLSVTGSVEVTPTRAVAACTVYFSGEFEAEHRMTVSRPGFLTVTVAASTHTTTDLYLEDVATETRTFEFEGSGPRFSNTSRIFLPADVYAIHLYGYTTVLTKTAIARTPVRVSARADFVLAGARTAGPRGQGKRYVALPASRACERGSLSVAVTSKAKRAAAIKRVRLLVNGRVAATVTDPRAGRLLKARLVRESGADVRVEVTLDKARKPLRAGATYVPCG